MHQVCIPGSRMYVHCGYRHHPGSMSSTECLFIVKRLAVAALRERNHRTVRSRGVHRCDEEYDIAFRIGSLSRCCHRSCICSIRRCRTCSPDGQSWMLSHSYLAYRLRPTTIEALVRVRTGDRVRHDEIARNTDELLAVQKSLPQGFSKT